MLNSIANNLWIAFIVWVALMGLIANATRITIIRIQRVEFAYLPEKEDADADTAKED